MPIRKTAVSGQFYPADKTDLLEVIRKFLSKKKENIKAAIIPHAGYMFSGKLAGKVIGRIANKKDFVILGVNHSGFGNKVSFSLKDFETPLGIVKNNKALTERILSKLKKFDSGINELAGEHEHSIEVELPFLQLSQKKFEIVPILLKDLSFEKCKKIAEILAGFVSENVCLLVSSDFTHYGRGYGFLPFTENIKENLYDLDNSIIQEILNKNPEKVYEKASNSTVCGVYAITILTEIAKLKKWKAELVDYYTSGDVIHDFNNCVGYAGIVFN